MIIIGQKYGQMANRLHLFGHFLANAVEHNYRLINPAFDDYRQHFKMTAQNEFPGLDVSLTSGFLPINSVFRPILQGFTWVYPQSSFHVRVSHNNNSSPFNLNDPDFFEMARSKIVIAYGWYFRDYINFRKHAPLLRQVFTPLDMYQENVRALLERSRNLGEVLVGVHIRRGDYKAWRGGQYYYDDKIYKEKMEQLASIFQKKGKSVVFLLCSDQLLDADAFAQLTTVATNRQPVEDLYALAGCDYLIGPPSTFSMWASFYGEVPLLHISLRSEKIDLDRFAVNYG